MNFDCINLHFIDTCNYKCKHCFVNKENNELSIHKIKLIVDNISRYFIKNGINGRINLAGGEPLLSKNINEIIDYIYSKNIKVSIITNGYYLTKEFISKNKTKISCIGISVDSLDYDTNLKIGRCEKNNTIDSNALIELCKYIKESNIRLKINTCLSKLNVNENFTEFLEKTKPDRYKVLEMTCFKNSELEGLKATSQEIKTFLEKHKSYISIFEHDYEMLDSYIIIDSKGHLATNNLHISNLDAVEMDIDLLIKEIGINYINYIKRYL